VVDDGVRWLLFGISLTLSGVLLALISSGAALVILIFGVAGFLAACRGLTEPRPGDTPAADLP